MMALARELGIPRHQAVGIMVDLWNWTADYALMGDIGIYTDQDIAAGIGWEGDESELISALISSKWVDKCKEKRLIIHDWRTSCDDWIRKRMSRAADNGGQRPATAAALGKDRIGKVRSGKVKESKEKEEGDARGRPPGCLFTHSFSIAWDEYCLLYTSDAADE